MLKRQTWLFNKAANGIVVLSFLCSGLALCPPPSIAAEADSFEIFPVGRWVSSHPKSWVFEPGTFYEFSTYAEALHNGNFKYDEVFRNPYEPGPALVDCQTAQRIGVSITQSVASHRRLGRRAYMLLFDFEWKHDRIELRGREVKSRKRRYYQMYNSGITLGKDNRANGIYTVTASYRGTEVYRTQFEINNCESGEGDSNTN